MKNKTTVNLIAFATTLLFSIAVVTPILNNNISAYFQSESDFRSRVKVYNFLLADKARHNKFISNLTDLRLASDKEAMKKLLTEREMLYKTLYNERLNADISELPKDFQNAWAKFLNGQRILLYLLYSKEPRDRNSDKVIAEEFKASEEEFRRVVGNYGFELAVNLTIIE